MAIATAGFGAAILASPAAGASSIVSVDTGQPKAEIATTVKVRTISEVSSAYLYVKYRAVGGPPCAPTPDTDPGAYVYGLEGPFVAVGDTTTTSVVTFRAAGSYDFCSWLRQSGASIATSSGQFSVASPVGSITAVAVPTPVPRGRPFTVSVSGQTEVKRELVTFYRPASQPACAASPKLDNDYGHLDERAIFGAFTEQLELTLAAPGRYRLCSWVASSQNDLAPLGVNETIITVPAPIVVAAVRPKVTRLAVQGRNLTTKVRLTTPGKLQVALVGKGRRIGLGTVRVAAARSVTLTYHRPGKVPAGRYVLEVKFTVNHGPATIVRRGLVLG
jgi:hypothetical protein